MKVSVVIPNWNGAADLPDCLDSLLEQSVSANIIMVDNASTDGSVELVKAKFPQVDVVELGKNRGFAGGVNAGIKRSIESGHKYVALFNNDAVADKTWLKSLVKYMDANPKVGIAAPKILSLNGKRIDSTGECYTVWGLPYPRGRGERDIDKYDNDAKIFGASGGASIYRVKMLQAIGLFDEDFFAYYEDIDLSFRAQLAGWKVAFAPQAIVYHQIGATSGRVKDFTTYQTLKNLPMLMWKNVPWSLMPKVWLRFELAYSGIVFKALLRGQFLAVFKGTLMWGVLAPKKFFQRHKIQKNRKVSTKYIESLIIQDLPPQASGFKVKRRKNA